LCRKLLKKFAENQADTADKTQQALISKDLETAQRLAHSIEGGFRQYQRNPCF
jgi:HPt (histidine-containing phosphotransfer) domain-containing protein